MIKLRDYETGKALFVSASDDLKEAVNEAISSGASFINVDLRGKDLTGIDFSGIDFSGALLTCSDMSDCNLSGCNFSSSNLSAVNMTGANLSHARIMGARIDFMTLPANSYVVHAGGGIPFFLSGDTIEVFGHDTKDYTYWLEMDYNEAMSLGGRNLADKLGQMQKTLVSLLTV